MTGTRTSSTSNVSGFREVTGEFPAAYRFAATALLPDGDVVVAGGYSDDNANTAGIWRVSPR